MIFKFARDERLEGLEGFQHKTKKNKENTMKNNNKTKRNEQKLRTNKIIIS